MQTNLTMKAQNWMQVHILETDILWFKKKKRPILIKMNPVLVDPWQVGRPMLEPTAHKAFPARMFKQQQQKKRLQAF